ncbi:hypothetical protein PE067_10530 [Paracoccus sp. DMF-8]|uniref:hypothetical protein n=1 Tax=Paracoccus sp. DMF-8 TaxID=3019445 RepID=UPI0023E8D9AB|nr:hypothetical protein [Paracoccus sp. DMF-8]MDF3606536.1 hypothetical protein [Paracoccus sp. DMF-8]
MSMREQLYISGGGMVRRKVTSRKGREAAVIDPNIRCRTAIINMYAAGFSVLDIAYRLGKTQLFVLRELVNGGPGKW